MPELIETQEPEYITTMPSDTKQRIRIIKRVIQEEEAKARQRLPLLDYQDTIGMAFFVGAISISLASSYAYLTSMLPWYFTIPITALAVSVIHEMEHDLIHNQYFRGQKWVQSIMFSLIWLFKFHANPWYRRDIHHWHHRVSGQSNDIEERFLGLGMQMNWQRLGVTLHPLGMINEIPNIKRDAKEAFDLEYLNRSSILVAGVVHATIKAFPILLLCSYFFEATPGGSLEWWSNLATNMMVIVVYPLVLRQSCLVAMSTACHYYGDIPEHNVFFQNQIVDHWLLWPFQMFCWGFGSTHIIHHYIPNQPFYMRSIIKNAVHKEMIKQGVRKNDWGIIQRANRWHVTADQEKKAHISALIWFVSIILFGSFTMHIWDLVISRRLTVVLYKFSLVYGVKWLLGRTQKPKKLEE